MVKAIFKGGRPQDGGRLYLDKCIVAKRQGTIIHVRGQDIVIDADPSGIDKAFYALGDGTVKISGRLGDFKEPLNHDFLEFQKRKGFIPFPFTILKGVMKAPPGLKTIISAQGTRYEPGRLSLFNSGTPVGLRKGMDQAFAGALGKERLVSSFSGGFDSLLLSTVYRDKCDYFLNFDDGSADISRFQEQFLSKWIKVGPEIDFGKKDVEGYFRAVDEPNCDSAGFAEYLMIGKLPKGAKGCLVMNGQGADAIFCSDKVYFQVVHSLNSGLIAKVAEKLPGKGLSKRVKAYTIGYRKRFLESYCGGLGKAEEKAIAGMLDTYIRAIDNDGGNKYAALRFMLYYPLHGLEKIRTACSGCGMRYFLPFMDEEIIKLAFSIPSKDKTGFSAGKKVLKEAFPEVAGYLTGAFLPDTLKEKLTRGQKYEEFFTEGWLRLRK